MPNEEKNPTVNAGEDAGAVLLNSGYDVLSKILAGSGQLKFTRAVFDGGDIPEGTAIEDLTEPVKYERDGVIVKVEDTGRGEATVVVQTSSIGVQTGFFVKGVMLYVEDPEGNPDAAYSYLPLQSDPVWVRPEGDAVNKLVSFEIINIVSSASRVIAVIRPEGLARAADLEAYASRAVGMTEIPVSIPVSAWKAGESTTPRCAFYADLADNHISMSHFPDVTLDNISLDIAADCGLSPTVEIAEAGKMRFYARSVPEAEITGVCRLLAVGIGGSGGSSGGGGEAYVLPVATLDTLGGIKASSSVIVERDGTARVFAEVAPEHLAQDEDMSAMLNEVFGPEGEGNA